MLCLSVQRGRREMFIGGNDKETVKNIMRSDRKSRLDDYYDKIAGIADKTINTFILFKQY